MAKYLTKTAHGVQARIRIKGVLHSRHFKKDTPDYAIQKWLLTTQLKYGQPNATATGRFVDDARAYLAAVAAMPSIATRTKHIEEWIEEFGTRQRDTITAPEIAAALNRWRLTPRQSPLGAHATRTVTLSGTAVNHRRTALMHLWTVMDGKHMPNPVRSVPKFRDPERPPRALSYTVIRRILRTLAPSKSKARLYVMAYTGLPQAQLVGITPEDVDLKARLVRVQGRKKGAGTKASVRPLTRTAAAAFRYFARQRAWGAFNNSTLRVAFRAACERAGERPLTPYVLRHSFITATLALTGDLQATQELAGHYSPQQTLYYAQAARTVRLRTAIDTMDTHGRKSGAFARERAKTTRSTP